MLDLKLLRVKNKHMTQVELSKESKVNRATISAIENGKLPSITTAKKIADVFKIDWRCFYD